MLYFNTEKTNIQQKNIEIELVIFWDLVQFFFSCMEKKTFKKYQKNE